RTWLPPGVQRDSIHADADGEFVARLPEGVSDIGLSVAAAGFALHMARVPLARADGLELALERTGGELVLNTRLRGSDDGSSALLLLHEGALESIDFLSRWGAMNGGGAAEEVVIVPQVEPGEYALCLVPAAEMQPVWSGDLAAGRCS